MLAGYAKRDGLSTEGAIKYFLLGSFSSAIFLFGLAFTFGYTGTTNIRRSRTALAAAVGEQSGTTLPAGLVMGLALLTTGVAFKIAAVPFHYWTPDAYQGSPTPVTGYLSVGPEGRRLRADPAALRRGPGPLRGRLGAAHRRPGRPDDDAGQPRPRSARTTSSGCWPTARSPTPATSWSAWRSFAGAPRPAAAGRPGIQAVLFYSVAYTFMNLGAFAVRGRAAATARV